MEHFDSLVWGFGIGLFFLGIAVGIAFSRFNDKYWRQSQSLEREMHSLSNNFHAYRTQVADHFIGSAKLINKLTEDYRNIYHHLAVSSENLVGAHIAEVLEFKNAVIVEDLLPKENKEEAVSPSIAKADTTVIEPAAPAENDTAHRQDIPARKTETPVIEAAKPVVEENLEKTQKLAKSNDDTNTKQANEAEKAEIKQTESRKKVTRKAAPRKPGVEHEVSMEDSQSLIRTLELVKEQVQEKVEQEKNKAKRGRPRKTAAETSEKVTVRKATKRPKKSDAELEDLDKGNEPLTTKVKEKIA